MAFFVKDADVFYYEEHGSGEPIILLNGFGRSLRHWFGFDKLLAKSFRVIVMDHRGVGRSKKARQGWDLNMFQMADDVSALMDHLNIDSANIAGLSMGGMVAMAFGLRYPDKARSLTIMNSSISGQKTLQVKSTAIFKLLKVLEDRKRYNYVVGHLLVSRDYPDLDGLKNRWHHCETIEPLTMLAALKQFAAIKRFRVRSMLSRLSVPSLILKGSDDRFVPSRNSDRLHQSIPNSKLETIVGGGHEMTIDHPKEVVQAISTFIAAVSSVKKDQAAA